MTDYNYVDLGCWEDQSQSRAFPERLSGKLDPPEVITKCMQLARAKGYDLFALQSGGECWGGPDSYMKYGSSTVCNNAGTGGSSANQVYRIEGRTQMEDSVIASQQILIGLKVMEFTLFKF